jgi:dihydrofolate reductase
MRKIILYSAISLDGFIAQRDGSIDWLNSFSGDYGYEAFLETIDTTIMGNKTYRQVLTFGEFPYYAKSNYVFSRGSELKTDQNLVKFISSEDIGIFKRMKDEEGRDIWLVGGGEVNSLFLKNNLIDEMRLFVMPIILGSGIPLFDGNKTTYKLNMISHKIYSDSVAEFCYSHSRQ